MIFIPVSKHLDLLKAAVDTDPATGYASFLKWQNFTDMEGAISRSEMALLPYAWKKYYEQLSDNPLKDRFGGIYKKSFFSNAQFFQQLLQIIAVVEQGNYAYALTNDIALNYFLYPENGVRPVYQADIIVEKEELAQIAAEYLLKGYYYADPAAPDYFQKGELPYYVLAHASLPARICLHGYPAIFHNQKISNDKFLNAADTFILNGCRVKLLKPQQLLLFLFISNQFSPHWYWMADLVLLMRKYDLSFEALKPIVQETGLFQTTFEQLNFLNREFGISSPEQLIFFDDNALYFTDRCLMRLGGKKDRLNWRLAIIANNSGMNREKEMNNRLLGKIIAWYYNAFRKTPFKKIPANARKFFRDILNPG